jgi:sulfur-oxidizing protein SoxB
MGYPFLASNIYDANGTSRPSSHAYFERGGVKVAVIGQAMPYTPIANPRWMFPNWSFGIRPEEVLQANVEAARAEGADVVVLLSHNGFDVDRKLASRVDGIDVILSPAIPMTPLPRAWKSSTGHAADVVGLARQVSRPHRSRGEGRQGAGYSSNLIPVFSDVITPDPEMAAQDRRGARAL